MDAWALQREGNGLRLSLKGDWSLAALDRIERALGSLPEAAGASLVCDWHEVRTPALGTMWALLEHLAARGFDLARVRHEGLPPHSLALLTSLNRQQGPPAPAPAPVSESPLARLGRFTVHQGREARGVLDYFGRIVIVAARALRHPHMLRMPSIVRHVYETGVTAIPIVALLGFLISVVIAYLGAQELANFGATIYTVDLVAISVLRELGVLLTAILVAGRSGSAFAAEIGVMQINQEIDALLAMGMNPIELLVLPRVTALLIALPGLTIVSDAMGLAGGALLSQLHLHIPLSQFTARVKEAISPTTFWAGLIKAPVFGVLIAMVGTYRGMQVRESARELGRLVTVAVVQSIFFVILIDALFAVFYEEINF